MLNIMMLRKRVELLQAEQTNLRARQAGFATRETELATQIRAASTEEDVSAATTAVSELEEQQRTTQDRLDAIQQELDELQEEIQGKEAAATRAASAGGTRAVGSPSHRRSGADHERRCSEFQRTGRMYYEDARSMVTRAALLTSGTIGPTGVGGINDAAGNTVSSFIDLIKLTDCTGMAAYKVAYVASDPTVVSITEGKAPTESEPTFGYVELKPSTVGLLAYISREIRKQTPLQYEAKVNEAVTRALRRKMNSDAVAAVLASTLTTPLSVSAASGAALFTPHLLSDIILAYGGDEGVDGAATLVLNKADLKAFAAVRGTNEYLPVYSIVPDTSNPSCGVIKDNNGLSCRYCLSNDVAALSTAALTASAKNTMFYGNPQCCEMGIWGGVEVVVNEGYKFGEGLLTIRGEVSADSDVTVKNGFIVVSATVA